MKKEIETTPSAELSEQILNLTPSCIYTVDINRNITGWNERIKKLTGYSPEEVLGKHCILCDSADADNVCPLFNDNIRKPIYGHETEITTKSGQKRIISKNIDVLRNNKGEIIGGVESFEDITGRKRIEEALYWQAGVNSVMAELSKVVISFNSIDSVSQLILEHAGRLTSSDFGFVGFFSEPSKKFVITSHSWSEPDNPEEQSLETGIGKAQNFFEWFSQSKESVIFNKLSEESQWSRYFNQLQIEINRFVCTPAFSSKELLGVIVLANSDRDYTEQDAEILERMASLFGVAIKRFKAEEEIRIALEKEHELNELKSRFISMVSHEYRTPLQAISLSTELLNEYADRLKPEDKTKHFKRILQSINTMNNLIDDIIFFNKVEIGQVEFSPFNIDINSFCRSLAEEFRFLSKDKCIIELTLDDEEKMVNLDERIIRHVLSNILNNAIKYSKENTTIEFNVHFSDHEVVFRIKDQGIGIPEKDQEKLFQPFVRGTNVGTISGTGLGLSIVKHSIEIHGGRISFFSKEGEGTEFTVKIPVTDM